MSKWSPIGRWGRRPMGRAHGPGTMGNSVRTLWDYEMVCGESGIALRAAVHNTGRPPAQAEIEAKKVSGLEPKNDPLLRGSAGPLYDGFPFIQRNSRAPQ